MAAICAIDDRMSLSKATLEFHQASWKVRSEQNLPGRGLLTLMPIDGVVALRIFQLFLLPSKEGRQYLEETRQPSGASYGFKGSTVVQLLT